MVTRNQLNDRLRDAIAETQWPVIHGAWGVESPNGFLTVVFVADEWSGEPMNAEPGKHAQVCWVDVDAVPAEFVSTTESALRRYLTGGPQVSLDGWTP